MRRHALGARFARLTGILIGGGAPFLLKEAALLEQRTERAMQRLVTLDEPAMIVRFGGIVGFVALSLMQATYGFSAGGAFR